MKAAPLSDWQLLRCFKTARYNARCTEKASSPPAPVIEISTPKTGWIKARSLAGHSTIMDTGTVSIQQLRWILVALGVCCLVRPALASNTSS